MCDSAPRSASDLFSCGLRQKSRSRQASFRSRGVDLIDKSLIKRDIDPDCSTGVAQKRYGEQKCPSRRRLANILVAHDVVYRTRRLHGTAGALQSFDVLTQRLRSVHRCLLQRIASRKTPLDIRKPDAERAVGVFLNDGDVLFHFFALFQSRPRSSWTPSRQFIDSPHQSGRQISTWMGDCYDLRAIRFLEGVVVAVDAIQYPSVLLQHFDQLAAVLFHLTHLVESGRSNRLQFALERAGIMALPHGSGGHHRPACVYIYTHTSY